MFFSQPTRVLIFLLNIVDLDSILEFLTGILTVCCVHHNNIQTQIQLKNKPRHTYILIDAYKLCATLVLQRCHKMEPEGQNPIFTASFIR